jgi:3-hydroxyisobutyrate dehydrogenase-like beta-hydroxyacid dehydrogenase
MSEGSVTRIGLVGYGEVGRILAQALVERELEWVGTWDILLRDPAAAPAMREHAIRAGVEATASLAELLARAEVVISAVTASQALAVAEEAAPTIRPGTWFVDLNSASPGTKARSAELLDARGARFVEAAVMTSVPPYGIRVPMLLGGAHARSLRELLLPLGFSMEVVADRIGTASAIKMCRSVIIKGMEAIFVESLTAARAYGVEKPVLASLQETFPAIDWDAQAAYFFSRVALHGKRRAEEMREVAVTVREAGLDPFMAAATAERQDWVAGLKRPAGLADVAKGAGWEAYADRLLAAAYPRQATADP